jgi:hypothetical protein
MLDTITLSGNLIIGFGVPSAPQSMLKKRLHLILKSGAFHPSWQWEVERVVPGCFSCTPQEAKNETQDGLANQVSFLTSTLQVPQPSRLRGPVHLGRSLRFVSLCFRLRYFVLHLVTDLIDLLYTTLICKRFLSLLNSNQTFACLKLRQDCKRLTKATDDVCTPSATSSTGVRGQ